MGKLKFTEAFGPGNLRSVKISQTPPQTYTNLLGETVVIGPKKKVNPMIAACGKGPEDRRCKHCKFIIRKEYAGTYYKCEFRGNTNGPGTDHRVNWPTCGKFQLADEFKKAEPYLEKAAIFSNCGTYRYVLHREWDRSKPSIACIGLNPSTANADEDDPTIESLVRILKHGGYGSLWMLNLFAVISPDPEILESHPDPIGENDRYLESYTDGKMDVLCCWGQFKQATGRAQIVSALLTRKKCLGVNADGSPRHPLYKKATTPIIPFEN